MSDTTTPANAGSAAERQRITFFCGSVIGYRGDPAALPTRALADALGRRGHIVRLTEERMNAAFTQTLREVGGDAVRTIHDTFPHMQMHAWETRQGAQLLEWLTRELALVDVAVVVDGAGELLTEWVAMIERRGLVRVYLHWESEALSSERAAALHLDRFDLVLSAADGALPYALAPQDIAAGITMPDVDAASLADAGGVAQAFERAIATHRSQPGSLATSPNGVVPPGA